MLNVKRLECDCLYISVFGVFNIVVDFLFFLKGVSVYMSVFLLLFSSVRNFALKIDRASTFVGLKSI